MSIIYWLQSYFYEFGLHMVIAIIFAIHVLKTGRHLGWLLLLFLFPFMGSIAYFFFEFMKNPSFASSGRSSISQSAYHFLNPQAQLKKKPARV